MAAERQGGGDPTEATEHIGGAGRGERTLLVIGRSVVATSALPPRGALILGRSRSADLLIDDRTVSRRHARLVVDDHRITVEDLGSANGTRIGHQPVAGQPTEVAIGQPFHLGAVTLVIEGPAAPEPRAAASDPAGRVEELAARLAAGDVSILLQGETGRRTERLAEHIHARSPRARGRFVGVDCAAGDQRMLEGVLFGGERGAGALERAAGGTLFLDQIDELGAALQGRLLGAIEDRADGRAGGVRTVASTTRELEAEAVAGRFLRDLYYRLAGATLYLAPPRNSRAVRGPGREPARDRPARGRAGRAPPHPRGAGGGRRQPDPRGAPARHLAPDPHQPARRLRPAPAAQAALSRRRREPGPGSGRPARALLVRPSQRRRRARPADEPGQRDHGEHVGQLAGQRVGHAQPRGLELGLQRPGGAEQKARQRRRDRPPACP